MRFLLLLLALLPPVRAFAEDGVDRRLSDLAGQLAAHFQTDGELQLEWTRLDPGAAAATTLVVAEYPSTLAPQMVVRVRAVAADGVVSEVSLILRAQLWRDGWATREPSGRGDSVLPAAMDLRRYDALRERDAIAADPSLDLIFTRALPAGRLLGWRDVTRRPLVRRGELIEVAAADGPLIVTLRAVAMQDGGRGEVVRVRNPDSKKEFTAQVIAESRALVRF
jgi:flagella basal body P-ring formation protein FlgA